MLFRELANKHQNNYTYPIILAKQNGKIYELNEEITSVGNIDFITIADKIGFETYIRSIQLLMIKSFYKIVKKRNIESLKILFSVGDSLYVEANGNFTLTQDLLDEVKEKMLELVAEDYPITKRTIHKDEAMKLFKEYHMFEKEKLFRFRRVSHITLYSLGHFEDYFYGDMASSTGILKYFDLKMYKDGFLILLPNIKNPTVVTEIPKLDNLFNTLKESTSFGEKIGINTVADLNQAIVDGRIDDVILMQESLMEKKFGAIAEQIYQNKEIKFVMIAGPSSLGKTSSSHRLSIQLRNLGLNPHPIAVDDYFINRDDIPVDENGNRDFESIDIVDIKKFNEDMQALLNGERVEMPRYNFVLGQREYKGDFLQLKENDILIIEGIHCLNDKLSYSLKNENKFRIYISPLTGLNIDEHNRVPSSDVRLIRRTARDARTRGADATMTISMWDNVRKGEEVNIFPYQENADVLLNSSLIYELLILKEIAEPLLFKVDETSEEYFEAKRILKFLDFFLAYNDKKVPCTSLLKEFIGGSYFNV